MANMSGSVWRSIVKRMTPALMENLDQLQRGTPVRWRPLDGQGAERHGSWTWTWISNNPAGWVTGEQIPATTRYATFAITHVSEDEGPDCLLEFEAGVDYENGNFRRQPVARFFYDIDRLMIDAADELPKWLIRTMGFSIVVGERFADDDAEDKMFYSGSYPLAESKSEPKVSRAQDADAELWTERLDETDQAGADSSSTRSFGEVTEVSKPPSQDEPLSFADLRRKLEEQWGVSATAAAPLAASPRPEASPEPVPSAHEQPNFDVILSDYGAHKLEVMKVVAQLTGLSIQEAKSLVDATPTTVLEGVSEAAALVAVERLRAAGATAWVPGAEPANG
jgi:large subunit ribosomal protein L7/L12